LGGVRTPRTLIGKILLAKVKKNEKRAKMLHSTGERLQGRQVWGIGMAEKLAKSPAQRVARTELAQRGAGRGALEAARRVTTGTPR
jgi:hypothetical protein